MSKYSSSKISETTVSQTDWKRLDEADDTDIDLSECPEITPEMFARAVVRRGLQPVHAKEQVTLHIDADVLAWWRSQGNGYQTRINALLRAYMEESKHNSSSAS